MSGDQKSDVYAQEKQNFIQHFSQIVRVLTEEDTEHPEIGDVLARLKEVLEYNAIGGKYIRGLTVLVAFKELVEPSKQDAESMQRVLTVGWCVELLQAFFLVADDIMDSSLTRRGRACWYQKPGIGLDAINDAFLLESCIYRLLRLHCREQPYYLNLLELFLQTSYQTEVGQTLDLITAPQGQVDLSRYTEKRYKSIVKYKTAFYSFYLPVAAAMYMAGIDGEKEHSSARGILTEMGEFFQIQDDFLDLFGDPSVTGKIGTDIQDNKCSWLVVQCLQRATLEQRQILQVPRSSLGSLGDPWPEDGGPEPWGGGGGARAEGLEAPGKPSPLFSTFQENYGQKDAEKVARVKALYEELDLPAAFLRYEEDSYSRLQGLVQQHAASLPAAIFLGLANKISTASFQGTGAGSLRLPQERRVGWRPGPDGCGKDRGPLGPSFSKLRTPAESQSAAAFSALPSAFPGICIRLHLRGARLGPPF